MLADGRIIGYSFIGYSSCDHGVVFPLERAAEEAVLRHMTVSEIRQCFPRLFGECLLGCGFNGIAYASSTHYTARDW